MNFRHGEISSADLISKWILLSACMFFCFHSFARPGDLTVRSYVDQNSVAIGEQFTLSVELSGADADEAGEPDLPDLSDFAQYMGNGTSQSIQIINGRMSSTRTINYYFRANQKGRFEIGPVVVDYDGEFYETEPITMEVTDQRSAPRNRSLDGRSSGLSSDDLFLEAEVSRSKVYRNQPLLLSFKIYTRVNVSQYSVLNAPDTAGFWAEDLLKDRQVESTYEIINGQRYTAATIWKQVLFPTKAGKIRINPMEIECQVRLQRSRSRIDDFFNDPFSTDFFGRTVRYSVASKPVDIEVLPLPSEGQPADFNGMVGDFKLSGGVDNLQVRTNDVVTYTLTVEGSGNFRTLAAPQLRLSPGIESYEPEVSENLDAGARGLTGTKTFKYLLVPRTPGPKKIEEVRLTYFDPDSASYQSQSLSPVQLQVQGSNQPIASTAPILSKKNVRLLSQEIRFIKLESSRFFDLGFSRFQEPLFWALLLMPLVLLGIAGIYRRHLDRLRGDAAYARRRSASKQVKRRLKQAESALKSNNEELFFAESGKALRGFIADKLNLPESAMLGEGVKSVLLENKVSEDLTREYVDCLEVCETRLFSPLKSTSEERDQIFQRIESAIARLNRELSQ